MPKILFINGPNLNMLGIREKEFYGDQTLEDINAGLRSLAEIERIQVEFFQSNHEGELVDRIQQAYQNTDCIVINPGAFTHYSIAIYDALKTVKIPVIELHLSNIYAREEFRSQSLISPLAAGGIFGFGPMGYTLAFQAACKLVKQGG
jgi:3-dehydroquinate dehydratase-2